MKIKIKNFETSNNLPIILIAGPCQIESRDHSMFMAESIKSITDKLGINFIYKSSFDKANRTSISGRRGIGLDASLKIFDEVKTQFDLPVLTDVHNEEQCDIMKDVVDIIQIPAFLCRQTDLLIKAGNTGIIINVKKGQFLAPWDMKNVAEKIASTGNDKIMLTERGACFGYNNLVSDMRSLPIMSDFGYPVIFDATHSVQQPGGKGNESGGDRRFVAALAKAAVAVGVAGLFMEVHQDPDSAPSDGPCMLRLDSLETLLKQLIDIDSIVKS